MRAFLLATGEHNKLHPLTTYLPSPMLPIANRPVITYPIELLVRHQFHMILIGLLRQAYTIEAYCETGRRWNATFTYLLQREALGNAGALKRAQSMLTDTFLLMPGDALVDVDLTKLHTFHRAHGGIATAVLSTRLDEKAGIPVAQLDSSSRILAAQRNAWQPNALCYTDVYMFEPEVLDYISSHTQFDCQTDLLQSLLADDKAVYGYVLDGYWNPLDSFAGYQTAQQDFLRSLTCEYNIATDERTRLRHPYAEGVDIGDNIWRGTGASIHPSVQLKPPVFIGAGCQIGRNVTIGPDVVLGPNSIVDDGATIESSTVLPDTYIGKLVQVQKKLVSASILVDIESDVSVEVTDRTLLGMAGTQTANALLRSMLERLATLIALILAVPFIAVLMLLTWLAGGGPALVREPRIGRVLASTLWNRKPEATVIRLYRLRTRMDNGSYTNIGRWLERWDAHRLPELVNVLLGELALVGVKPLTDEESQLIVEEWQSRRFDCPAGFTGRWYTESDPDGDIHDLFIADAYQTAMQSTGDSIVQLFKTPVVWWRRCKVTAWSANQSGAHPLIRRQLPQYIDDNPLKQ